MNTIEMLKSRLQNYPGAHPNEKWKLETDLTKCTAKEKSMMKTYDLKPEDLMAVGFNRGEVAHMFWGYKYEKSQRGA